MLVNTEYDGGEIWTWIRLSRREFWGGGGGGDLEFRDERGKTDFLSNIIWERETSDCDVMAPCPKHCTWKIQNSKFLELAGV